MPNEDTASVASGGPLKRAGLVGPAQEHLDRLVLAAYSSAIHEIAADPDSPKGVVALRVASLEDLRDLAERPPQGFTAALGPVLCPMLDWVRLYDQSLLRKGRKGWTPTDNFERALRALQNGWYEDALERFGAAVERDNPEDFVSLFGLAQLTLYWVGLSEAAMPLLEKAARYAVPVDAQPWMKRFASEAFLACATLYADVKRDYTTALQRLDNAEQLTEPRPEIHLTRARVLAMAGRTDSVAAEVGKAVAEDWVYAVRVAVDPAFPPEVVASVAQALDAHRNHVRAETERYAEVIPEKVRVALAQPDSDIEQHVLDAAKVDLQKCLESLQGLLAGRGASLLKDLALAGRLAELNAGVDQAVAALDNLRHQAREEVKRASLGHEMFELQARQEEIAVRRSRIMDEIAKTEERLKQELANELSTAKRQAVEAAIKRGLWIILPVFVLILIYRFTDISLSQGFIGMRGSAPAAPSASPTEGAPATRTGWVIEDDMVLAQTAPPSVVRAQQEEQAQSSDSAIGAYHLVYDRWVWFAFVIYVLLFAGLTAKGQWEAYETKCKAISQNHERRREEIVKEQNEQRLPLDREHRALSERIEELRVQL